MRGASPTVARPATMSGRRSDGGRQPTERPGLVASCCRSQGLIGLAYAPPASWSCEPQGGPKLLASIYDLSATPSGAPTAQRRATGARQAPARGHRPARRRRRHLALVPRCGAGRACCRRSGATASCHWSSSARRWCSSRSTSSTRGPHICAASRTTPGQFTLANYAEHRRARLHRRSSATTSSGWSSAPALSVILGLLIAGLFDRIRRESLAKTIIFLPLAISLVGASVIWGFVYAWQPAGQPQFGLLNAVVDAFGGEPMPGCRAARSTSSANRDPGLAPDRVRDGRLLGRHQGRADECSRRPGSTAHRSASSSSG